MSTLKEKLEIFTSLSLLIASGFWTFAALRMEQCCYKFELLQKKYEYECMLNAIDNEIDDTE
jgi:hypothetical protein